MLPKYMPLRIIYLLYIQYILILLTYLLTQRFSYYLPEFVFWISVVIITCIIGMQIKLFDITQNKYQILIQIILFSLIIRTIFIPNTGFFGHDPYKEMEVVNAIVDSKWSLDSSVFSSYKYQYCYPILYELIILSSSLLGVSIYSISRWLPLLYSVSSLLFIYLLSNQLFNSVKSSLITVFGASMLYQCVMFHTLPIRESIAFLFFVATLYTYFKGSKLSNSILITLSILFAFSIALSHHLTSFLIVTFLFLHLVINSILKILLSVKPNISHFSPDHTTSGFFLYILVLILGYWIYLKYSPLDIIEYALQESAYKNPGHGMVLPNATRFDILVYGEYIFAFIFALLSIYSIIISNKKESICLTFLFWAAFMGILSLLALKGMVLKSESVAFASRFQSFGYISLFILSGSAIGLNRQENSIVEGIKTYIIFIYILFILFNIYRIPSNLYS